MIKCFIFDLTGVVFNTSRNIINELAKKGYDREKLSEIGGRGRIGRAYYFGRINFKEYKEEVKKLFPKDYEEIIYEYFSKHNINKVSFDKFKGKVIDPYDIKVDLSKYIEDGKISMLDILNLLSQNYDLCVFSGNNRKKISILDEKYDFLKCFKYKVFSFDVGYDKPDRHMFEKLVSTIPYKGEECLYLDDVKINIDIAEKEYGINGILFRTLV